MNEISWQLLQMLMWGFGIQSTLILAAFGFMSNHMNKRFDQIEFRFGKLENRMDKFDERMTKLEHDMIEVKTILRMKECCMISDERQMKKAE